MHVVRTKLCEFIVFQIFQIFQITPNYAVMKDDFLEQSGLSNFPTLDFHGFKDIESVVSF